MGAKLGILIMSSLSNYVQPQSYIIKCSYYSFSNYIFMVVLIKISEEFNISVVSFSKLIYRNLVN
jgi:hypothetical protein